VTKRIFKRFLPDPDKIRNHKHLRLFGRLLHDPNLWHFNRRSVSGAVSIGLFVAFIPVPIHMVLAAAGAIVRRANLPIAVALVWVNNPFTMAPIFYFAYKFGAWVLGTSLDESVTFEMSLEWIMKELTVIWQPFLFGCLVLGMASAVLGSMLVRLLWRLHVVRYLTQKRLRRQSTLS